MELHPNAVTDSLAVAGVAAGAARIPRRITTGRLVLQRVHPDDVAAERLHALFATNDDPDDVFDLCGWDEHADVAETRAYLERMGTLWERGERYEYVLEANADGEYVGTTCLEVSPDDGACEFALWLRKPRWGRGFCAEGTDALVHVAFEHLEAPFAVAGCRPANGRSRRAIEKFVARYDGAYYGTPPVVSSGGPEGERERTVPHHEWTITRDQYASGERGLSCTVPGVAYEELEF